MSNTFPIGEVPDSELGTPQDVLSLYWSRGQSIEVLFGDIVIERYGRSKDRYSLYVVDNDVEEFQGGDIRVIQRLGGGL